MDTNSSNNSLNNHLLFTVLFGFVLILFLGITTSAQFIGKSINVDQNNDSSTSYQSSDINDLDLEIRNLNLTDSSKITSPFILSGEAHGWFENGNFTVQIVDSEGNIIGSGEAVADENSTNLEFISFTAELFFNSEKNVDGQLLFINKKNNTQKIAHKHPVGFKVKDIIVKDVYPGNIVVSGTPLKGEIKRNLKDEVIPVALVTEDGITLWEGTIDPVEPTNSTAKEEFIPFTVTPEFVQDKLVDGKLVFKGKDNNVGDGTEKNKIEIPVRIETKHSEKDDKNQGNPNIKNNDIINNNPNENNRNNNSRDDEEE